MKCARSTSKCARKGTKFGVLHGEFQDVARRIFVGKFSIYSGMRAHVDRPPRCTENFGMSHAGTAQLRAHPTLKSTKSLRAARGISGCCTALLWIFMWDARANVPKCARTQVGQVWDWGGKDLFKENSLHRVDPVLLFIDFPS